ncbi:MAG TPA: cytochrome c oxidase subunit 3 family protein [Phycisphaerales bacterium]|nr:cytochrome c oxidase subunit 3 family protein [Phycisphaerales bacterium]
MTTIDAHGNVLSPGAGDTRPYHERYVAAPHFRDREHEFSAVKFGVWLFLSTEVLLFSGMFVGYATLRYLHPEAFRGGAHHLDTHWGLINTIVLLISSYTIASAVRAAQLGRNGALQTYLMITNICALAFILIKFVFEYSHKWHEGLLPGKYYSYPNPSNPSEPLWWGIYWGATGIHATHVAVGIVLITWLWFRARKQHFGPTHYNAVEGVALYWHIVDIVWIFLFPLLYLIH